jgi:hypothetical protein
MADDDRGKITIPENHQEFCKAIARLCREYEMQKVHLTYTPRFRDPWDGNIAMSWEEGRHGEDSDKIFISSEVRVYARLSVTKAAKEG